MIRHNSSKYFNTKKVNFPLKSILLEQGKLSTNIDYEIKSTCLSPSHSNYNLSKNKDFSLYDLKQLIVQNNIGNQKGRNPKTSALKKKINSQNISFKPPNHCINPLLTQQKFSLNLNIIKQRLKFSQCKKDNFTQSLTSRNTRKKCCSQLDKHKRVKTIVIRVNL